MTAAQPRRRAGEEASEQGISSINSALEALIRLHASRRVFERHSQALQHRLSRPGLTLLRRLSEAGPLSMGELAREARMDNGATARQTAALAAEGLVERTASPSDGRIIIVALTQEGTEVVHAVTALQQRHMRDALADWSAEEIDDFADSLDRFVTSLRGTAFRPLDEAGMRRNEEDTEKSL